MRILTSFGLLFCSSIALASAGEGELKMKFSMPSHGVTGQLTVHFSKAGTRTEMTSDGNAMMTGSSTLVKSDNLDVIYQINDAQRSYSEINRQTARKNTQTYTVKKAGSDTIAGYKGEHAIVTGSSGDVVDVWLNKDLYEMAKAFRPAGPGMDGDGVMKALKAAGMVGIPVKFVVQRAGQTGESASIELVSVTHKAQPASLFEIPDDYKKSTFGGGAGGGASAAGPQGMTPEQRAMIMQNMTPEQRAQFEKAMGAQGQ